MRNEFIQSNQSYVIIQFFWPIISFVDNKITSFDFPFVGANSLVSGRVLLESCTLIKDGINKLNFRPMM